MSPDVRNTLTVEELLESCDFRMLRAPTSRIENVRYTDENKHEVAERVLDFLATTGETLDEENIKIFLIVNGFTPNAAEPDTKDDLDAVILFYTNESTRGARRIEYKFVVPAEDVQVFVDTPALG